MELSPAGEALVLSSLHAPRGGLADKEIPNGVPFKFPYLFEIVAASAWTLERVEILFYNTKLEATPTEQRWYHKAQTWRPMPQAEARQSCERETRLVDPLVFKPTKAV